jgi:hypothetical protein
MKNMVFLKRKPGMLDRIGYKVAAISAITARTCIDETLVPSQIGARTRATAGERVLDIEEIDAELLTIITKMKYPAMMVATAALTCSKRILGSKTIQSR